MSPGGPGLDDRAKTKLKVWIEEGMDWKGWKTPQLAEKSGLSRQTVSRLVNRKIEPTEDTLTKLARALERPLPADFASRVSEGPVAYLGGTSQFLEFSAKEAINILGDAVVRAKAVLGGKGDPGFASSEEIMSRVASVERAAKRTRTVAKKVKRKKAKRPRPPPDGPASPPPRAGQEPGSG